MSIAPGFVPRTLALAVGICLLLSSACETSEKAGEEASPAAVILPLEDDPHSYSRPRDVSVRDLDLSLYVDFDERVLEGVAVWTLSHNWMVDTAETAPSSRQLLLDTQGLEISRVERLDGGVATRVDFELGPADPLLGRALSIPVDASTEKVLVAYKTSPAAAAVQWLEPSQTAGGVHPFLFTQSQAIFARTWIPCQDTPGVRFTYKAVVTVPDGLTAVMSAEQLGKREIGEKGRQAFFFDMPQPIPSYLVALGVGELSFRAWSDRAGVWAEPSVVESAASEFIDTEDMIVAAEKLFGPYRWGRYDLLVLPPSFPFGGMENPRLTFVTPTVIAGDRSLVALIAHELAHSWSGNLVTNANWNGFWLNEGFTVYLEHRIMESIRGREYDEMLAEISRLDLSAAIDAIDRPADTHLDLDLAGRDPDEGMTAIAYDKGYFFLRKIEETVGRERFDEFLRRYFDTFAFQPMTTQRFLEFLRAELIRGDADIEKELRIEEWVHGPGLPDNAPVVDSSRVRAAKAAAESFAGGVAPSTLEVGEWTTHEWLIFLRALPESLPVDRVQALDDAFSLTRSGNAEILSEWFQLSIHSGYEPAAPRIAEFLRRVGRRKFLTPIYGAMATTAEGLQRARTIYSDARPGYHQVSRGTLDTLLGYDESGTGLSE